MSSDFFDVADDNVLMASRTITLRDSFRFPLPLQHPFLGNVLFGLDVLYANSTPMAPGLQLDQQTGLVNGIVTQASVYTMKFSLVDPFSQLRSDPIATIILTVLSPPPIPAAAAASLPVATIAASVGVGGSALIVLVAVIVVLILRERRKPRPEPFNFSPVIASLPDLRGVASKRAPREINRDDVQVLDMLTKSKYGQVHKGLLDEIPGQPGYIVAVKSLHIDGDRAAILQEAALMAQFQNPFVVQLIGVVTLGDPLLVLLEYCEYGALNSYLEKNELTHEDKHRIAADCCEGLAYLSEHGFVHRDVAARNILMSSQLRAKIADFGMSCKTIDSNYYLNKGGQLPVRWAAPEGMHARAFNS